MGWMDKIRNRENTTFMVLYQIFPLYSESESENKVNTSWK